MKNLSRGDDFVNEALAPLIDAITQRWEARDQRELSRLREATAPTVEDPGARPRDRFLHPVRRCPRAERHRLARGQGLARGMEGAPRGRHGRRAQPKTVHSPIR